jgi:hypothetical protein
MFETKDWLKKTLLLTIIVEVVYFLIVPLFVPFPHSYYVGIGMAIMIVWLIHIISGTTKDPLKETLVLILLVIGVSFVGNMFFGFPYSLPFVIGIVILIVWLHRRSKHAYTLDV